MQVFIHPRCSLPLWILTFLQQKPSLELEKKIKTAGHYFPLEYQFNTRITVGKKKEADELQEDTDFLAEGRTI
ncbi:hypothetical protein [Bacillus rubiinfantis]|uniref:hypothetical protein n=1 Tax=Bacillus rubiinfantis TaxID=1499680 RepID=UPI0005AAA2E9|nr:hypothetical protein [Bacillus rubiinfantis]